MSAEESAKAVIENAQRLLEDAKLLCEKERYRTATSLAILAVEESGKACIINWAREGPIDHNKIKEAVRNHVDKQRIVGLLLLVQAILVTTKELFPDQELHPSLIPQSEEFIKSVTKVVDNGPANLFFHEKLDPVESAKQAGFYTDIDDLFGLSPRSIPEGKDAKLYIELAEIGILMFNQEPPFQSGMAKLYNTEGIRNFRQWRYKLIRQASAAARDLSSNNSA